VLDPAFAARREEGLAASSTLAGEIDDVGR
jgi:hypothetical protein